MLEFGQLLQDLEELANILLRRPKLIVASITVGQS